MFTSKEVAMACQAQLVGPKKNLTFTSISQDSRKIDARQLFVAILGERFDGHVFLKEIFNRGIQAAIVQKGRVDPHQFPNVQLFQVKDTLKALGDLAHFHRKKFKIPVIGITGSNGKTTTKEMVSAILKTKYRVLYTEGNLNNLIGVPFMIFRLTSEHDIGIFELGMSIPFEIKRLSEIASPTAAIITNIGKAHLATMKSMKDIAAAKGEIFKSLPKKGIAFVNIDDSYLAPYAKRLKCKVVTYGFKKGADYQGKILENKGLDGIDMECICEGSLGVHTIKLRSPLPGEHNARNTLAAFTIGMTYGISPEVIAEALSSFVTQTGRSKILNLSNGCVVIDDSYNANPSSMTEAIKMLKNITNGRKSYAVLGDMLELGPKERGYHEEIGRIIKEIGIDNVLTYGRRSQYIGNIVKIFSTLKQEVLIHELKQRLRSDPGVVLVKGSHGMKMENVVQALVQEFGVRK